MATRTGAHYLLAQIAEQPGQTEIIRENLQRLEHEVKKAADWRIWVERKPLVALGVAFAGGLWLATRGSSR